MWHDISGRHSLSTDLGRGPQARALAERVLVSLVHGLRDRSSLIVVLGGLVPTMLTRARGAAPPHLGTIDVDVLLSVQLASAQDGHELLEDALLRIGFQPDSKQKGWRWFAIVEGHRVNLEFLCDDDGAPADSVIRPRGATRLGALNMRGTRYVADDWTLERITAQLINRGSEATVDVRVAGLQGYLLAKAHAILDRGEHKDYYDFVYVIVHNSLGGPAAAAEALRTGKFAGTVARLSRIWDEIAARYVDTGSVGANAFASQSIQADTSANAPRLRQDAVAAVVQFIGALRRNRSG
jgi:hypothetical protein